MSVGNRIIVNFKRPSREMIELFRGVPVANIDDQMSRMYAVDGGIKPLNKVPLLGPAFTVRAPAGDNLMFHKALDMAQEGDILVISGIGGTDRAFSGEVMMRYAMMRKLGGFVIDGSVRDLEAAQALPFPVYARGIQPNGPLKTGPGEINLPVAIGGQVVRPGDILVGDQDGIVVIRPEDAETIATAARAQQEAEQVKFSSLSQGINPLKREWIAKGLERNNCEIIDS